MSIAISETAPSFDLPGVDGRSHSLDDYADARARSCSSSPATTAPTSRGGKDG